MWGNSLGWIISAVWTAAVVGSLAFLSRSLNTVSAPTDFSRTSGVADVIKLPVPPQSVLPDDAGPANAVDLYLQAIAIYEADHTPFDKFAANAMKVDPARIEPAVALLRQAAGTGEASLFADRPAEIVLYNMDKPPLTALAALGNCALNLGLRTKLHDKAAARKDYEAGMALGGRLVSERLCYSELSSGLGLLTGGARALSSLETDVGNATRAQALEQFASATEEYAKQLASIQAVLSSVDQKILEAHAGDVFWAAHNSKERMWRVEATLALGRYKFDAPRKGDNTGALQVATQMAQSDPDPVVKVAAALSRDLTIEQRNVIR